MLKPLRFGFLFTSTLLCWTLITVSPIRADEPKSDPQAAAQAAEKAPAKGQRVFSCGHSFHYFMPPILTDMAKSAGIKDHQFVGLSAIGGSRVIQHWAVPDNKNKSKEALKSGNVDVLTLAPIHLPVDGIEKYAQLAMEHNPSIRVTVQEFWLPTTFMTRRSSCARPKLTTTRSMVNSFESCTLRISKPWMSTSEV